MFDIIQLKTLKLVIIYIFILISFSNHYECKTIVLPKIQKNNKYHMPIIEVL